MPGPSGSLARSAARLPASRVIFTDATEGGVLGGSLTGALAVIAELDRERFEPTLVLFEPKPIVAELEAQGVPVRVLAPRRGGGRGRGTLGRGVHLARVVAPRVRDLARLFRREHPALVYCSNGVVPSLPVVVAAALCGVPVVCHFKGFSHVGPEARLASRWVDVAIGMTDEIIAHIRAEGVRARRFVTIFDGIDCAARVPRDGTAVRRELGIPADAPLVGIVGHIQGWKGQLLVAEAVARVRREIPAVRCLMVGGVHRQGGAYAERLRARVAAPDLAGHVFLTGARPDVLACMDAMDVVLHASDREPFGRVLIEAMAVGRPVIAPREGGPLVIVADGETGLLVPPRDPDALAAAIIALLRDPARRAAMGRAARARVESVFGIQQYVRAVEGVFDDVLAARSRATAS